MGALCIADETSQGASSSRIASTCGSNSSLCFSMSCASTRCSCPCTCWSTTSSSLRPLPRPRRRERGRDGAQDGCCACVWQFFLLGDPCILASGCRSPLVLCGSACCIKACPYHGRRCMPICLRRVHSVSGLPESKAERVYASFQRGGNARYIALPFHITARQPPTPGEPPQTCVTDIPDGATAWILPPGARARPMHLRQLSACLSSRTTVTPRYPRCGRSAC